MAQARQQRQRARQRQRAQRQRERTRRQAKRQSAKSRRQEMRQLQRTTRQTNRALTRQERVKQKGASGYYSPEGIKARGDVATGLIGQGLEIGGLVGSTGFLDGLGSRRDAITDIFTDSGIQQDDNVAFTGSMGGGGGGGFDLATHQEEKPFYQNPLVIGGAVVGGILLYRSMSKKRK